MTRYSGDYAGTCKACDDPMEFAIGLDTEKNLLRAMHFGPGGPQSVNVLDWEAGLVTESQVELHVTFACPVCEARASTRIVCRNVTGPGDAS